MVFGKPKAELRLERAELKTIVSYAGLEPNRIIDLFRIPHAA